AAAAKPDTSPPPRGCAPRVRRGAAPARPSCGSVACAARPGGERRPSRLLLGSWPHMHASAISARSAGVLAAVGLEPGDLAGAGPVLVRAIRQGYVSGCEAGVHRREASYFWR